MGNESGSSGQGGGRADRSGSLRELMDRIEARHHSLLRNEVPRLQDLVAQALTTHESRYAGVFRSLGEELARLWFELDAHMQKEEGVLFPFIRELEACALRGEGKPEGDPARLEELRHEHENAADRIGRIRRLTGGYAMPADADAVLRELYTGLRVLEDDLILHIELEDGVLIPRAIAMAQSLTKGETL